MLCLFFSLLVLLFPFLLSAEEARQKICLNMIVKDESRVIKRCLESIKPLIDYWVIVDTGSRDDTKKIIKKCLQGIPGELHERRWRNFGENRTEAFQLAKGKGDYILFMDADDVLEFDEECRFPLLTKDLYNMWRGRTKSYSYHKPQLVKGNLPWKWVGVTHEYLACDQPYTSELLEEVRYITRNDGASSCDPNKFLKNIKLLEEGLKQEPNNERYAFYLAESYRAAGEKGKAIEWFQKRIKMGGWDEEMFWSMLQIGHLLRDIGLAPSIVIASYHQAHDFRPHRVEPLYSLVEMYNQQGDYAKAYEYVKKWDSIPKPAEKDSLFNMDWMEEYGLLFQLSICSYFIENYQESLEACDKLLTIQELPESWRHQTVINRKYPLAKLEEVKLAKQIETDLLLKQTPSSQISRKI
jgi:glycosyltransferase involved in cell wall biosynthesis